MGNHMASEKEPLVKVKLLRATWKGEEKQEIGTVIEMPVTPAMWAVKDGLVEPEGENPFKKG
jgi:hypothetical protein